MVKLTAGIITLNEERDIEACISSLSFCHETLIVDAQSSDRTRDIAQKCGARVLVRPWTGFADQRNFLLQQAQSPWVLFLDADERFPQDRIHELFCAIERPLNTVAFRFPRRTFYLNRWITHGGWYPDYQTRLLKQGANYFVNNHVHEAVKSQGTVETLSIPLIHYPFRSIAEQIETNNRYSSLLAERLSEGKKRFSLLKLLVKPSVKFFECYVIKRGFLDGLPGLMIAISAAYSVFLQWSKLWERRTVQT